jgi:hypothetical protein
MIYAKTTDKDNDIIFTYLDTKGFGIFFLLCANFNKTSIL